MNSQQVRQVEETAQQVHNALANALVSLRIGSPDFDTSSSEQKVILVEKWQRVVVQAIEDLRMSLPLLGPQTFQ